MGKKSTATSSTETPLMRQYNSIKARYPDALLLFRVGDFYETFGEDAIKAAGILGITLTKRNNGAAGALELAGFPYHALDTYLPRLVRAGNRVAICDQLEDPKLTKTIVKRGVTELVTPGVSYNEKTIDQRNNNFLSAIAIEQNPNRTPDQLEGGAAFLDVSTGEFFLAQGKWPYLQKLLQSFSPTEILYNKQQKSFISELLESDTYRFGIDDWAFQGDYGRELLLNHFGVSSLKGYGVEDLDWAVRAGGVALHYLKETAHDKVGHLRTLARIEPDQYVWLDRFTIRNLELFSSPNEKATTLLDVLDHTVSPMGARLLRRWLAFPLKDRVAIEERLWWVDWLMREETLGSSLRTALKQTGDLERLISKVAVARVTPRDLGHLRTALQQVLHIQTCFSDGKENPQVKRFCEQLNPCPSLLQKLETHLQSELPLLINKGGVMADGVDAELDELRKISTKGKDYLLEIQQKESEATGIPSLRISFNQVFGYYLEVTNTHKNKVPSNWIRKQTLANAERYVTEELKIYEERILHAQDKIQSIEQALFQQLVSEVADALVPIQHNATLLAKLDVFLSFGYNAVQYGYTKPLLAEHKKIIIQNGRHPVIERQLPVGLEYVANDVFLDPEVQQIMMITGPNMSGKSALLRQTALIVLMAQCGSFVPAQHAEIGLVDKIFTRVGASDNISSGESTFMVEMNETASILNNVSDRSLILLDEIGRGTSTYDGISIAWAIAEYLHEHPSARAKTLFATHYHELNEMAKQFSRIQNYSVSVQESGKKVLFLRKLVKGGSQHSFGIQVARMAGMPAKLLNRAELLLQELETTHRKQQPQSAPKKTSPSADWQLSIFQLDDPLLEQVREALLKVNLDELTPVEAMLKLNEIQKMLKG
jgi:DNA mismatch repair protein MutS